MSRSAPLAERFLTKVAKSDVGCWEWTGVLSGGYGKIYGGASNARMLWAHRVSYELHIGPIPDGLELDHLCQNASCVRPDHLEPVTRTENLKRGLGGSKGGQSLAAKKRAQTHCKRGHPFTSENTYVAKSGRRRCKSCERDRHRERRAVTADVGARLETWIGEQG